MNHVALDYETTYSDDRDINKLGVVGYLRHPDTDIYMVSMYGDGVEYVGHPSGAPWPLLAGRPIVAHNLGFDEEVSNELRRRGMPVPEHPEAYCTADMAACLQVKRDLGTATRVLEGVILDKSTRSRMKNQRWETMTPEFREEALAYALDDAKASWLLWENHSHLFPEHERRLSAHTRLMTARGLGIDHSLVAKDVAWLEPLRLAIEREVPWLGETDAKGKEIKIGSPKRLRQECEKMGIPPPDTTDTKDERFGDWAEEYAEQAPFVAAIQQWRKTNRFLVWCEAARVRSVDGRLRYSLKYCGAPHTRRWSGSSGVNLQNLAKKPLVAREVAAALGKDDAWLVSNNVDPDSASDMRGHVVPANGHKFITADLSQIEPRVLAYLSGQTALLNLMRTGMDVYEAQARAMGLYAEQGSLKEHNPALRQTVKALNLGLGYGLGEAGLMRSYRRMSGKKMEAAEAVRLVKLYRDKNPEVLELWKQLKEVVAKFKVDGKAEFELPSGRTIRYYNVRYDTEVGLTCVTERGSPPKRCWSGRSTENCLAEGTPVLTDSGWKPIEAVTTEDRLWDGLEWVDHSGVLAKAEEETINCHGVHCTGDHLFMTKNGWSPAKEVCEVEPGMLSCAHVSETLANNRPHGKKVRASDDAPWAGHRRDTRPVGSTMRLWGHPDSEGVGRFQETRHGAQNLRRKVPAEPRVGLSQEPHTRNVETSWVRRVAVDEGPMRQSETSGVPQLRREGHLCGPRVARLRDVLGGHGPLLPAGAGLGPEGQRRELHPGELSLGNPEGERPQQTNDVGETTKSSGGLQGDRRAQRDQTDDHVLPSEAGVALGTRHHRAPVYDILDAGPRHRFTVLGDFPMIVHNCVQAVARDVFAPMILTLESSSCPVVMHTHDELTCEVPEDRAEEAREHVTRVMSTSPEWAPGLPVAGVAGIHDRYEKD